MRTYRITKSTMAVPMKGFSFVACGSSSVVLVPWISVILHWKHQLQSLLNASHGNTCFSHCWILLKCNVWQEHLAFSCQSPLFIAWTNVANFIHSMQRRLLCWLLCWIVRIELFSTQLQLTTWITQKNCKLHWQNDEPSRGTHWVSAARAHSWCGGWLPVPRVNQMLAGWASADMVYQYIYHSFQFISGRQASSLCVLSTNAMFSSYKMSLRRHCYLFSKMGSHALCIKRPVIPKRDGRLFYKNINRCFVWRQPWASTI